MLWHGGIEWYDPVCSVMIGYFQKWILRCNYTFIIDVKICMIHYELHILYMVCTCYIDVQHNPKEGNV